MKRYRFVSATTLAPTADAVKNAKIVDDEDAILEQSESIAPFVWAEKSEKLTALARSAKSIEITEDTLSDGKTPINRVIVTTDKKVYRWRFFGAGSKNTIPAMSLSEKERRAVVVGYCKSGEDFVREEKFDAQTGAVGLYRVIYLKLSE